MNKENITFEPAKVVSAEQENLNALKKRLSVINLELYNCSQQLDNMSGQDWEEIHDDYDFAHGRVVELEEEKEKIKLEIDRIQSSLAAV